MKAASKPRWMRLAGSLYLARRGGGAGDHPRIARCGALLAALAMAAAVATTAIVQTGLERPRPVGARRQRPRLRQRHLRARADRQRQPEPARARADKLERNPDITRSDVRFLEQRRRGPPAVSRRRRSGCGDVSAGGRTFENATINGTQAALLRHPRHRAGTGPLLDSTAEEVSGAQVGGGRAAAWPTSCSPRRDPLGGTVRIGGRGFRVVGVQARQGTCRRRLAGSLRRGCR